MRDQLSGLAFQEQDMRKAFLPAFFLLCLSVVPALAATTTEIFPPLGRDGSPRLITWEKDDSHTYAVTPQTMLQETLGCNDKAKIVYKGGLYLCEDQDTDATENPSCGATEYLTTVPGADGPELACVPMTSSGPPHCSSGQALTSTNGATYTCANVQAPTSFPACGPAQLLTYNGSSFSCKDGIIKADIPVCPANQGLKYIGGGFTCVAGGGGSGSIVGGYAALDNKCTNATVWGQVVCTQINKYNVNIVCPAGSTERLMGSFEGISYGEGNGGYSGNSYIFCVTN
jgi:hypothetical protein